VCPGTSNGVFYDEDVGKVVYPARKNGDLIVIIEYAHYQIPSKVMNRVVGEDKTTYAVR
jgi:hypothetical protein